MGDRQSSPVRDGPHYFNNAHSFIVQNSTFGNMAPKSVLKWLGNRVISGAEFDSSERDPPPRCHPGTRLSIVQRIRIWLQNSDRSKNLLWLHGSAGVGKSAIIQSLAELESKSNGVIATLFFSALKGRNDPNRVFTTLAYQLAVQDASYQAYVAELMSRDPRSLDKAMSEQFRKLFVEPFAQRGIGRGATPWLILLDGLDECRPPVAESQAQSPSERAQCEIIKLISTFVLEYPSVPLLWIISSRPESHLMACFSSADIRAAHWDEEVPINSDEACQDVERYLRSELEKIRQQYPYHMPTTTPWPCEEHMAVIARSALGHFVFAATVTKFIEDPDIGDPIAQLDQMLIFMDRPYMRSVEGNPLAALDALYTSILQQINPATLPLTKRLLRYCLWVNSGFLRDLRLLTVICNILNIEQNRAYSALRKLYAVLHIPHPNDAGKQRLEFLHKSFVDYLRNEDRSHNFSLSEADADADPWFWSIRVLEQAVVSHELTPDISKISLCWCPVEKSAQVQLRRRVYVTAATLLERFFFCLGDKALLDKIQSVDFSTIIGGHFILGKRNKMYSELFTRLTHPFRNTYFTSHGFTRSISLGDVDIRHIRNDRLAHYVTGTFVWPGGSLRKNPFNPDAYRQDPAHVLQAYRLHPHRLTQLPNTDLRNPFSQVTGVYLPLSTFLDRLRLLQEQFPWAQGTIIGASSSTSCIVFQCMYTSDGKLLDRRVTDYPHESEPEGTKLMREDFVLPYFGDIIVEKTCFD